MEIAIETKQGYCPVCVTKNGRYAIAVNEFNIYKCSQCGLEHTHPMPSPAQLKAFYSNYSDMRAATDVVMLNARRNIKLLENFGYDESRLMLDFGTGHADFVMAAGENCFGVDFNNIDKPRCYPALKNLPIKKFEFITLWGVLEHLANPVSTLKELKEYLAPNGMLIMTTVNAEGPIPYYYKPVEHLTYWTQSSARHLLEKIGITFLEYTPYKMMQRSEVYLDRLLSRTPGNYKGAFSKTLPALPHYVEIPTNEVLIVGKLG